MNAHDLANMAGTYNITNAAVQDGSCFRNENAQIFKLPHQYIARPKDKQEDSRRAFTHELTLYRLINFIRETFGQEEHH